MQWISNLFLFSINLLDNGKILVMVKILTFVQYEANISNFDKKQAETGCKIV